MLSDTLRIRDDSKGEGMSHVDENRKNLFFQYAPPYNIETLSKLAPNTQKCDLEMLKKKSFPSAAKLRHIYDLKLTGSV